MTKSFKAFMKNIIDYAGLFPPASLSLDTSIRAYTKYRNGDDSWMLSRFIVPFATLEQLERYHDELFSDGEPFDFSVLGTGTKTMNDFAAMVAELEKACIQFGQQHGDRTTAEVLETKIPAEAALSCDAELLQNLFNKTADILSGSSHSPEWIFYEATVEENWKKDIETVFEAIARHNVDRGEQSENYHYAGFKLRCGGVEPEMFPSVEQVAFVINRAREYKVALKCTAGLHHPVRLFHDSVQTKMHGFFNVFGGAMVAYAHDLSDEELEEILKEEDPEQFSFSDEYFSWRDLPVPLEEVRQLREVALISFGSCSFDEPREDLQKLGLL